MRKLLSAASIVACCLLTIKQTTFLLFYLPLCFVPWIFCLVNLGSAALHFHSNDGNSVARWIRFAVDECLYFSAFAILFLLSIKTYLNFATLGPPYQAWSDSSSYCFLVVLLAALVAVCQLVRYSRHIVRKINFGYATLFFVVGSTLPVLASFATAPLFVNRPFEVSQLWIWMGSVCLGGFILQISQSRMLTQIRTSRAPHNF